MSLGKTKYAGLPDVDPAPEIYETPALTDDASTVQTSTVRTVSPTPSDEDGLHDPDSGLSRQRLNQDEARRRFEVSRVDARDVDFSDSLASNHRSYTTTSRRRRRRRRDGGEELGDLSESDDESLARKLARLRRETEGIKQVLRRKEEGVAENAGEDEVAEDELTKLSDMLDELHTSSRADASAPSATEAMFSRHLALDAAKASRFSNAAPQESHALTTTKSVTAPSSTAAITSLADRLTTLESALGLSSIPENAESMSMLPTLSSLSAQISVISSTLTSSSRPSHMSMDSPLPRLDDLANRIRTLTTESDRLTMSRKRATEAFHELHEARLKNPLVINNTTQPGHPAVQTLLDEQSRKINALYTALPTIQSLHPLLPTVLDRLRSLHAIHAGAATAAADLEDIERRQGNLSEEISRWKVGLERVENGMKEHEGIMKNNAEIMGAMIRGIEGRLKVLGG